MNSVQEWMTYTYQHAKGWRNRFDACGVTPVDFVHERDLCKLPVLKKEDLPQLQKEAAFAQLTAVPLQEIARVFMSPGPIYEPQGKEEDYWGFAKALGVAHFGEGDLVMNTFSYHLSPAGFMFDGALRKLGCTVIPAGVGNIELQLQIMQELPVNGYVGTPSYLIKLLSEAEARGYHHVAPSKAFFTAERITQEMRHYLNEKQVHYREGYGTAELGCIAYEDGGDGLKVDESIIVHICDSDGNPIWDDRVGEVVVTRFHQTYPLIRFGTGDLSRWASPGRLAGVLGRTNDMVKIKGMFVHYKQLETLLTECEDVTYFQVEVCNEHMQDVLKVYVEWNDTAQPDVLQTIIKDTIRVTPLIITKSINREEARFIDKRIYSNV
ncbi:phenylacetate--CoA ligase family protein [Ectobacillus antri]|uniref:Phenylacetate--CoA ligase family protein n=1 Tax=Ectobacillus antri TaxID=2486280 RepID=A0ABT6H318_9BACI|nr:phenylacetate--CoA ligase family protein [Ectobacillus antri]MDG4657481.1 phenylacetate--CoA ligase family protein [Ectobacillus antri]MDG5753794.1 phenylacetate--CoA ligase family protein [Ectobacillus antri]